MKYLFALLALFATVNLKAQQNTDITAEALVPAINLEISWHKTTLLIFPAPIARGVRGDKYVLADHVRDVDNVLQVKAGQKGFEPSNLNVVTVDGKVYVFNISYNEDAPSLPVNVGKLPPYAPATFKGLSLNEEQVQQFSNVVASLPSFLKKGKYHKYGMKLLLEGIYIKDDVVFLRYNLRNSTMIPYEEASLRFYIRDKKKGKRTAVQDKETDAVYVQHLGKPEEAGGQTIIAAFPRFTIAENKYFTAELMEKDGDRNPVSRLDQQLLLKARALK